MNEKLLGDDYLGQLLAPCNIAKASQKLNNC